MSGENKAPTDAQMALANAVGQRTVAFVNASTDLLQAAAAMHAAGLECDQRMEVLISIASVVFDVAKLKVEEPRGGIAAGDLGPDGFVPTTPTKGH